MTAPNDKSSAPPRRLGRGLEALLSIKQQPAADAPVGGGAGAGTASVADEDRGDFRRITIAQIRPNPYQPRKEFNAEELADLESSLSATGLLQPITVRPATSGKGFELIAGERRLRAATNLGWTEIPAIVRDIDDKTLLTLALVENLQRSDLNPIEEAAGYDRLIKEFGYGPGDLAQMLGRSRSHVANTLRLLNLAPSIQTMVTDGRISAGHARALLSVRDPEGVARRVVDKGLNVRDVERIAHADHGTAERSRPQNARREKDPDTRALEQALEDVLGLVVRVEHGGQGGELRIRYRTLEQLDGLCRRLRTAVH